jgi:ketosteroid isomerase-like protein
MVEESPLIIEILLYGLRARIAYIPKKRIQYQESPSCYRSQPEIRRPQNNFKHETNISRLFAFPIDKHEDMAFHIFKNEEDSRILKFYCNLQDRFFWGTVSPFLRTTSQGIKDYFKSFMGLEHLKAIYYKPMVRVYGDIAVNSGYYTFFHEKDGKTMSIAARYTFVYRKDSDGEWYIIDHHSSAAP